MKKLLIAMAIGAALAWAFDPDQGSRRRSQVKRQLEAKGIISRPAAPRAPSTRLTSTPTDDAISA